MAASLLDQLIGASAPRGPVEAVVPTRTLDDVVLPAATRRALDEALVHIRKHDLIFRTWGLGERHPHAGGLAFNFAGPPGTGKTLCAEAVAHALGRRLLVVRYDDLESRWMGQTSKQVVAAFRAAREANAVLFFDEADAIAGRRFAEVRYGYERESNAVVNVLLRELERFPGVVVFATNLATTFDPAFERRLRAQVLFERPDAAARARIWRLQLHPEKTPLAPDVDFEALAERFDATGGEILNAVLGAARKAAAGPGPDAEKRLAHAHFEGAMVEVLGARAVMAQSLFDADAPAPAAVPEVAALVEEVRAAGARSLRVAALALGAAMAALGVGAAGLLAALLGG